MECSQKNVVQIRHKGSTSSIVTPKQEVIVFPGITVETINKECEERECRNKKPLDLRRFKNRKTTK